MQARNQLRFMVGAGLTTFALLAGACAGAPANSPATGNVAVAAPTEAPTAAPTEAAAEAAPVAAAGDVTTSTQTAAPAQAAPAADDEAAGRLHVPDGFTLNTYISGLQSPRLMTVGPDGNLYVAERGAGAVIRLPDGNGDGVADERQVVAEGLDQPHNVEWHDGSLYVGVTGGAVRLTDKNNDGDAMDDGEIETVVGDIPSSGAHTSRTVHFGPDGMLYLAAGSSSNNFVESDRRRAAIMRYNPDGSIPDDNPFAQDPDETRRPVWAEGLRNSVDFVFLPDGRLWADHNGSDMLGDDVPPEEVVINVERGKHYGWPYCYTPTMGAVPDGTAEVQDTRVPFDDRISDCGQVTAALFTDLAHQAPLGMAVYTQTVFPADYQGGIFEAYHGSWNSGVPRECKVQFIAVKDGKPVDSQPFITGFRDDDTQICGDAWGRPAGVAVGANGELFVSDDQNGNIYRVVYSGGQ